MKEFTTMEKLQMEVSSCYGCVIKYGDHVITSDVNHKGQYNAIIYEFVETPEETGLGDIECRLQQIQATDHAFKDNGHAIAWALSEIK